MFDTNTPHTLEVGWLSVGANDVAEIGHDKLQGTIDRLKWIDVTKPSPDLRLPMSQGLGIKGIIQGFNLNATAIAYNDEIAPYTLLAVEAKFKEGTQRLYCIDKGDSVTPVRSDFYRTLVEGNETTSDGRLPA